MNSSVLDFATLKAVTNCQRQGDVERYLKKSGIRYFFSREGVWTTIDLVNAAGGIQAGTPAAAPYLPSDVF